MVVWELFLGIGILGSRKSVIQTAVLWPGFVPKWICQIAHLTKWSYCQLKNLQIIHNMFDWIIDYFHFEFLIYTILLQICSKFQRCTVASAYLSWKISNIFCNDFKQFRAKDKVMYQIIALFWPKMITLCMKYFWLDQFDFDII